MSPTHAALSKQQKAEVEAASASSTTGAAAGGDGGAEGDDAGKETEREKVLFVCSHYQL